MKNAGFGPRFFMPDLEMDGNTSGPIRPGLCLDIDDLAPSLWKAAAIAG
jgi:hypothetical protein